jgi:hypothetical protein
VISRGTKEFWALYHALSSESRPQARKAFLLFAENPDHPSLRFKKLRGAPLFGTYAARPSIVAERSSCCASTAAIT